MNQVLEDTMFKTEEPRSPYKTVVVGLLFYVAFKALVRLLEVVFGAS